MSAYGKKQPVASPQSPVYYTAQSSGYHQLGQPSARETTLKQEDVERLLTRSLAISGFLPAKLPDHPPTLVIFYTWGSHSMLVEGDADNAAMSGEQVTRNLLDRAALVGGAKFSLDMLKLLTEAGDWAKLTQGNAGLAKVMGSDQLDFINPINRYKNADLKNEFLFDQFTRDVYYVVASAYDYASVSTKAKVLFWRTRMTVAAQGVSQEQTLPTLIVSAGPFFGKEMTEPQVLTPRAVPEGTVEIGTATVVDDQPGKASADKNSKKP